MGPIDWGTMPAWLAAIGTVSGVWVAAFTYRSTSNQNRRAQASQIRIRHSHLDDGRVQIRIDNHSERPIYDPFVSVHVRSLISIRLDLDFIKHKSIEPIPDDKLDAVADRWASAENATVYADDASWVIQPTYGYVFLANEYDHLIHDCVVHFRDAVGHAWYYDIYGNKLTHVNLRRAERRSHRLRRRELQKHPEWSEIRRLWTRDEFRRRRWYKENRSRRQGLD